MELAIEKRLIDRARDHGDRRAFEQLYRAFAGELLVRVIRPRVPTAADAEDVLVETFVSALSRLETFTWQGKSIFHWLARIAVNTAIDAARRRQRELRLQRAVGEDSVALPIETARPGDALLAAADRVERSHRVSAIMAELHPRYAKALTLRSLRGLARSECAEAMGVKLGTFDVVFLRAVRAFRKAWVVRFGEEAI